MKTFKVPTLRWMPSYDVVLLTWALKISHPYPIDFNDNAVLDFSFDRSMDQGLELDGEDGIGVIIDEPFSNLIDTLIG